ncbi:MAG: hypothetical protein DWQ07_24590 [Chloroflexi bacterium]|nr:MAG: hypothetical protein DWQ07_24590 [Chloroflexota bacterium]MBL1196312.1 hypothetical protein [Chloroflexota bacterium]NOH13607.1 hypothetical protein [Chloroflexota bacterium]
MNLHPLFEAPLYLDPGSGSFILQLIIAGGLGALFMLRSYITRFFSIFSRNKTEEAETEELEHSENS